MIRDAKTNATVHSSKSVLRDALANELRAFSTLWEQRLKEFDAQAAQAVEEQRIASAKHVEAQEDIMRSQLVQRKPHFSKHVIRAREALESLIATKHFGDADLVQKTLEQQEAKELAQFHDSISATFAQRTRLLHEAAVKAMAALKQRIDGSKRVLLAQRKMDFMTLLQRHEMKRSDLEDSERRKLSKKVRTLQKKIAVAASGGPLNLNEGLPDDDGL